jgi:hypothetical protein
VNMRYRDPGWDLVSYSGTSHICMNVALMHD